MKQYPNSTRETEKAIPLEGAEVSAPTGGGSIYSSTRFRAVAVLSVCLGVGGALVYQGDWQGDWGAMGGNAVGTQRQAAPAFLKTPKAATGQDGQANVVPSPTTESIPQLGIDFDVSFSGSNKVTDVFTSDATNVEVSLVSFEDLQLEVLAYRQVSSLTADISQVGSASSSVFGHNRSMQVPLSTQIGLALKSAVGLHPFGGFSSMEQSGSQSGSDPLDRGYSLSATLGFRW